MNSLKLFFALILSFSLGFLNCASAEEVASEESAGAQVEVDKNLARLEAMPPCAQAYMKEALRMRTKQASSLTVDYTKGIFNGDFKEQYGAGPVSHVMATIAIPIVGIVDGIGHAVNKKGLRNLEKIAAFIAQDGSKDMKKGMGKMYRVARRDFEISKSEFSGFVAQRMDKNIFCEYGSDIELSEKGKQVVGNQSFMTFMYQTHMLGKEDNKAFWQDMSNFQSVVSLKMLSKSDRELALLRALESAGFKERVRPVNSR